MIIGKSPLRMSFLGGGTDLPAFYRRHGGAVVSTSIDKYIFTTINQKFDDGIRVSYSTTEITQEIADIQHPLVRFGLLTKGIKGGVEITTVADIPSGGTGLGSSSSFVVSLLNVLSAYNGEYCSPEKLAKEACYIEIELCNNPIGKQDQYAAAFGGLNLIEFNQDDSVSVSPVLCKQEFVSEFENQILCFYTGKTRSATHILHEQSARSEDNEDTISALKVMKNLAYDFVKSLYSADYRAMGCILDEGWRLKRSLTTGITDQAIDTYYNIAMSEGAWGGKLLGAGGGGFLMFQAPPERHEAIIRALSALRPVSLPFSKEGARIIFYHPPTQITRNSGIKKYA